MSTWHQRNAHPQPVLWHATLWTVVNDPHEKPMSVDRYRDPVEAQRVCDRLNSIAPKSAYVLSPSPTK